MIGEEDDTEFRDWTDVDPKYKNRKLSTWDPMLLVQQLQEMAGM